ncbi:hypothetical protein EPO15_11165 [bacterium]|nr:MAG: hypothetical protein EPO15_11165 [bacterium]
MAFPKVLTLAAVLLAGCPSGGGQYLRRGYRPPASLAVLPFDNRTTDLDGPVVARVWFDQRLGERKGYRTLPLEGVDSALRRLGITDGGQLRSRTAAELCAALGTEALVHGDLLEFGQTTTGFLNVRRVKAAFEMKACPSGETLWRAEGTGAESETAVSAAGALRAGLKALGTQLAEKALGSPLRTQTLDMVWNAIEFLPPAGRP